jgi:hypothetical protein
VNFGRDCTEESRTIACYVSLTGHPAYDNGCCAITGAARQPWV